jgi:hypothetical protein
MTNVAAHVGINRECNVADAEAAMDVAYAIPSQRGILRTFASPSPLTALDIVNRIMRQREQFKKRYEKKSKAEGDYTAHKSYVQEV